MRWLQTRQAGCQPITTCPVGAAASVQRVCQQGWVCRPSTAALVLRLPNAYQYRDEVAHLGKPITRKWGKGN